MDPATPSQSVSYTFLESGLMREVTGGRGIDATYTANQVTSFATSINFLWTLGLVACVGAAAFVWVRGGVYGLEASESGIRKRNEEWKRGSLGLLGVMVLFLLIYTVNRGLLRNDVSLSEIGVGSQTSIPINTTTPQPGTTAPNGGGTEAATRSRLAAANISINKSSCALGQTNCTNVAGVSERVISVMLNLRLACPTCVLVITGGTEPGHSASGNHPRGEAVDLRKTSSLTTFLQSNATLSGSRYLWGGLRFYDEPAGDNANTTEAHFHVD